MTDGAKVSKAVLLTEVISFPTRLLWKSAVHHGIAAAVLTFEWSCRSKGRLDNALPATRIPARRKHMCPVVCCRSHH